MENRKTVLRLRKERDRWSDRNTIAIEKQLKKCTVELDWAMPNKIFEIKVFIEIVSFASFMRIICSIRWMTRNFKFNFICFFFFLVVAFNVNVCVTEPFAIFGQRTKWKSILYCAIALYTQYYEKSIVYIYVYSTWLRNLWKKRVWTEPKEKIRNILTNTDESKSKSETENKTTTARRVHSCLASSFFRAIYLEALRHLIHSKNYLIEWIYFIV